MTVAGMIGPRGLLAVFPSTLSFYERIGMDDEHRQRRTYCTYKHVLMEKQIDLAGVHMLLWHTDTQR